MEGLEEAATGRSLGWWHDFEHCLWAQTAHRWVPGKNSQLCKPCGQLAQKMLVWRGRLSPPATGAGTSEKGSAALAALSPGELPLFRLRAGPLPATRRLDIGHMRIPQGEEWLGLGPFRTVLVPKGELRCILQCPRRVGKRAEGPRRQPPPAANAAIPAVYFFTVSAGLVFLLPFVNVFYREIGFSEELIGVLCALKPWVAAPAGTTAQACCWGSLHRAGPPPAPLQHNKGSPIRLGPPQIMSRLGAAAAAGSLIVSAADASRRHMAVLLAVYLTAFIGRSFITFFTAFSVQLALALLTEAAASPMGALVDAAVMASATDVSRVVVAGMRAGMRAGRRWWERARGLMRGGRRRRGNRAPAQRQASRRWPAPCACLSNACPPSLAAPCAPCCPVVRRRAVTAASACMRR